MMNKKVKILFVVVAALAVSYTAKAQDFQIGYVQSTGVVDGEKLDPVNGIRVGINSYQGIAGPLSLQYGLHYSYYQSDTKILSLFDAKYKGHQLDIPLRIEASLPLAGDLKLIGFAGPDFSYVLSGTSQINDADPVSVYEDEDFSRFNVQLGVGAGLKYRNATLRFSYDWGVMDQYKSDNISYKTNTMGISLSYEL